MAFSTKTRAARLHVGAGDKRLEGWVNIDLLDLPGVDVVADVTRGLDFDDVEAVFAEHFLEHLRVQDALGFLLEVHRALRPGGAMRLSTPNLDWVWVTHYAVGAEVEARRKIDGAIALNRGFYAWGHRFLWNRELLDRALRACGFAELRWHRYGESDRPVFRGLERHETYEDAPDLPHVLIVEAAKGDPAPDLLADLRELLRRDFLVHLAG
jgi:predicted SAM-dependent methyltransferase